ncbi:MAG TPA: carbohydrate ABC transporter permease [Mycobacterium sp.]
MTQVATHARRRPLRGLSRVVFIVLGLAYLSPLLWLFVSSFKRRVDIFNPTPTLSFTPTLDNYVSSLWYGGFLNNLYNSMIVAGVSTLIALIVGVPAAYSLARSGDRGKLYMLALLAARMLPAMVLAVPLFVIASNLGLTDTYAAVIAAHLTFSIPFTVWMMRGFFAGIPAELHEAARLDGCSETRTFFQVILPLAKGGLAATAIFCVINSWNEFLFALVLTGRSTQTLPVAIPTLITPIGTSWGQIAAVGTVTVIPVAIFAFIVQKHIISGITGGAMSAE